jgi:hypothetical protein
MQLIGISGKIGVGKSSVANFLLDHLPGWHKAAFAGLLKTEIAKKYGFDLRLCYDEAGKASLITLPDGSRKTVRELLQWYGTDVVRAKDPHYWVSTMERHLRFAPPVIPGHIIDDVRFPDEANFVRRNRGLLVRINPYPDYTSPLGADHASETALDSYKGFSMVLSPEFGVKHLEAAAAEILKAWEER